jgi:hypothetical protein
MRFNACRANRSTEGGGDFRRWLLLGHLFKLCDILLCPRTFGEGHWRDLRNPTESKMPIFRKGSKATALAPPMSEAE